MRKKAEKLEKGKWYADFHIPSFDNTRFLKFSHYNQEDDEILFEKSNNSGGYKDINGIIPFPLNEPFYLPTQEDREKYNLIDDE